ncbi:uracil-DNA glycosylase [Candidatus Formimonas warabiya]|uniref:Type-4 uracil-DNA glycosylase n=1 Tax=Formimonas warabiya TaxID=1761012 RepID=A0A3G1KSW8_FORW1|nr:uracil-DNA glycosylase [Candidatus Formimonas warabiya]ATW25572.1 uracil-DNA glycosylase [Candidatus Formimonas warabiya]
MDLLVLEQQLQKCHRCDLGRRRIKLVFGKGSLTAPVMFIGEGPGEQEDIQGQPFVGKAGQLLDKIIAAAGFSENQVYICNVVKCRPPGNRLPNPVEVEACKPFLREQIRSIRPRIIVCLGALAAQTLINPDVRITRDRGAWVQKGNFKIMPTFHPAALLRDPAKKRLVWEDMKKVRDEFHRMREN